MSDPSDVQPDSTGSTYYLDVSGLDYKLQVVEFTHSDIQHDKILAENNNDVDTRQLVAERLKNFDVADSVFERAVSTLDIMFYTFGGVKSTGSGFSNGDAQARNFYGSNENFDNRQPQLCALLMPDAGMTAAEWIGVTSKGSVRLEDGYPEIFDDMARSLVRFHEESHCFEADETQADLMALYHISAKYGDEHPTELTKFIEHLENARVATEGHFKYSGITQALRYGMQQISDNGMSLSDAEIRGAMLKGEVPSFNPDTAPPHTHDILSSSGP